MCFETSFEVSFETSFARSFLASFELSFARSFEVSFESSFEMSDGRSYEVSFRVSFLRCFPANSEASFPMSFQRSNDESDEAGKRKVDGESDYRPRYGAGLLRKSVVMVSSALMPVGSTDSSMSNRSEWFIAVMPRSGLPPPRNMNRPGTLWR